MVVTTTGIVRTGGAGELPFQLWAGQAFRAVDRKMDKAADKVADVAAAKDPAREAGKMLGAFLSGDKRPKG